MSVTAATTASTAIAGTYQSNRHCVVSDATDDDGT